MASAVAHHYCCQCSKSIEAAARWRCSRCKVARYCGPACQRQHWAGVQPHRLWCYEGVRYGDHTMPEAALPESDAELKACGDRMREAFRQCPVVESNALFSRYVMLCYSALCHMRHERASAERINGEFLAFFEAAMLPFVVDRPMERLKQWLREWDRSVQSETPSGYALRALTLVLQEHADAGPEEQARLGREALRAAPYRYTDEQIDSYIKSMKC